MGFTTQIFTFVFLPIVALLYFPIYFLSKKVAFLRKCRATDLLLVGLSLCFYAWSCFDNVFWLCAYVLIVYLLGRILQYIHCCRFALVMREGKNDTEKLFPMALIFTLLSCAVIAGILVFMKYTSLTSAVWNFIMKDSVTPKSIMAPLGLSFITFSAVSYIVDIYKGKAKAGSLLDCLLYLSFFPKVVSGPIVLYRDFNPQSPVVTLSGVSEGVTRVMIGFAKKVILADTFGLCISKAGYAMDVPTAVGMGLLYMLQIYYDFSGYSDVALGLSKMIGFDFAENFNFPYLSTSITEFWRRWHISLGRWFREYVYFPLGGSRCSKKRVIINISVVFLLTGIWHGAGWTYMLWGMINGICNIFEKLLAGNKIYEKVPKVVKWFFTMGVTFICWQLFRAPNIRTAARWILSMFGLVKYDSIHYMWQYYFDAQIITFAVIGILGATVFGLPKIQGLYKKAVATKGGYLVNQLVVCALFVLSILFMINSSYSPFLYFQY